MDGTSVNTGHAVSKKSQVNHKLSLNVKFFCYTYKLVHELEYEKLYHKL